MKILVLGVPHTQTTTEFTTCPFTMKAWNQCRMFHRRGHEVIHLGVEGSDPDCSEHVSIMPKDEWASLYGHPGASHYDTKTGGKHKSYHERYARNLRNAILARVDRPWQAIISATWGGVQQTATKSLRQFVVETGIGYRRTWANYRVFHAYAWMHFHWGLAKRGDGNRWYDVVIPNVVDPDNFDFRPEDKQEYFLYMGRLNEDKGVRIAIDVAWAAGRPIKIVGQGDPARFLKENPHVTYMPPVGIEGRRELMAEAATLLCPTQYVEPFGNVALEAQASGTPVISTDWGGFTETVLHGHTGYRCRTMDQFLWAARNIDRIDPAACRNWIVDNFSPDRIVLMYEEYFQMLLDLENDGWYRQHPQRERLDWLRKAYPMTQEGRTDTQSVPHAAAGSRGEPKGEGPILAPEDCAIDARAPGPLPVPDVVEHVEIQAISHAIYVQSTAVVGVTPEVSESQDPVGDEQSAERSTVPKIFGIGLSKTGNVSLYDALILLGYNIVQFPRDPRTIRQLLHGDYKLKILDECDGLVDGIASFYRHFDELYPGSRFILTIRDRDSWLRSVQNWWRAYRNIRMDDPRFFYRLATYGTIDFNPSRFRYVYERHVLEVEDYFRGASNLLVMDIAGGDGWDKLCPFLGQPVVNAPFPHSNKTPAQGQEC